MSEREMIEGYIAKEVGLHLFLSENVAQHMHDAENISVARRILARLDSLGYAIVKCNPNRPTRC